MEKNKKASGVSDKPKAETAKKRTPAAVKNGVKQKNYEDEPVKSKKKSSDKTASSETKSEKKNEKDNVAFFHKVVPYLLVLLAIFVTVCFVIIDLFSNSSPENGVGVIGLGIRNILCGVFGIGGFFVPAVIVMFASVWVKAAKKHCLLAKTLFGLIFMTAIAAIIHVIYAAVAQPFGVGAGVSALWNGGKLLAGGGVIGGLLGELCYKGIGPVGALIILPVVAFVFAMLLLGVSASYLVTAFRYGTKKRREKRERAKELREKRREEAAKERERRLLEEKRRREEEEIRREEEEKRRRKEEEARWEAEQKKREEEEAKRLAEEEKIRAEEERKRLEVEEDLKKIKIPVPEEPEQKPLPVNLVKTEEKEEHAKAEPAEANPVEETQKSEDMNAMLHEVFGGGAKKKTPAPAPIEKKEAPTPAAVDGEHSEVLSAMKEIDDLESVEDIEDDGFEEIPVEAEPEEEAAEYVFPPITLLAEDAGKKDNDNTEELMRNAQVLMDTLKSFNVKIKEITYSRGPTITRYELKPDVGVRVRSIANLVDDISLNLATTGVRIEAPIPGKPAVGIEVPNEHPTTVYLRSLIETEKFESESSKLTACLGADVGGKSVYFNIAKMPHLLIAGATGMGKSVCINSIIVSLLYKARPDEVKLILIDPKKVEFNIYKDIPHLYCPIVSDPAKAAGALASAVAEMERRFALIEEVGVRDIFNYNAVTKDDPDREFMPQMVIIIDELADLMMTAKEAVESSICRLAQKARAAGIHIIIGTQRPSVDVITGLLKANIPSRIACTVASQVDSRTIIDIAGAERLVGKGDMLFAPVGLAKPMRVQGAFVHESEVEKIVSFIKENNVGAKYNEEFIRLIDEEAAKCTASNKKGGAAAAAGGEVEGGLDPKFKEAVELAIDSGKVATSLLQRRLEVGYGRAAKIIDQMEQMGFVSAPDGNKPRKILVTKEQFMQMAINDEI